MRGYKMIAEVTAILGMTVLLGGCGKSDTVDATTITVHKNGSVDSVILEEFEKDYYDEEELNTMVTETIATYNRENGDKKIKLQDVSVNNGIASSIMTYQDAIDYASFNEEIFFSGTVAEAYDEGFDFDVQLTKATTKSPSEDTGTPETITKNDILTMGSMHIVIAEAPVHIRTYKNITYISENVSMVNEKEVIITSNGEQPAYILFQ
ncbi:MAG: hypothetical protein RRX92_08160 [Lachnospiraceae bacterium]